MTCVYVYFAGVHFVLAFFFPFVHEAKSVHISPMAPLVYALWIIAMQMQISHQLVVVNQGDF